MKRMLSGLAAAALALGLAACETGGEAADDTTTTGGADTAGSATETPQEMGGRMEVQLEPVNNSGASGEVYLTPVEGSTTVVVVLEQSDSVGNEGQSHAAHIHSGNCENIGGVVAPLEAIVSNPTSGPTSTTFVQHGMETIGDGNHLIAVHEAGGEPGRPIMCAEIPAQGASGSDTAQAVL